MAVRTRAELKADAAASIPDNVVEAIDPADVRERIVDLADSVALPGEGQTWTGAQKFGRMSGVIATTSGASLDNTNGNEHTREVDGSITFTTTGVPPTGEVFDMRVFIIYTSGTITFFSGITWAGGNAPAFTGGKSYEVALTTRNGGAAWVGAWAEY